MAARPNVRTKVTETAGAALGLALSSGGVALLTGGTGLKDPDGSASGYGGQLLKAIINVSGTTARRVKLYLRAAGGSVSEATKIFDETIAGDRIVYYMPRVPDKYKDSAVVFGTQDAGTDVFVRVEAVEYF